MRAQAYADAIWARWLKEYIPFLNRRHKWATDGMEPVCRKPVCRILELKKNNKTNNVGMMQSMNCASDMSPFPLVPHCTLGPLMFPFC